MSFLVRTAWNTVFERFFCPDTKLIYEFVTDDKNNAWHHLPNPEDIKEYIPNPRGWGTGMEDSALNGGCALEALVEAYGINPDEEIKKLADALLEGLLTLEKNGFVARSISPIDKKSHYPESSRDQYTHYVYSLLKCFLSPICRVEQKEKIKSSLLRIADKCEKEVTKENDYHMLRADGKVGMVGKMWGELAPHEWLRLPMFYLAAYKASQDEHYKNMYLKYRDEAFENSLLPMQKNARCYCYLQMQYSLRLIYDFENDCDFKQKVLMLMQKNAEYGRNKAITNSIEFTKPKYKDKLSYRFLKWNEAEKLSRSVEHGIEYFNPAQSERADNSCFYPVREVAEGALTYALCPGMKKDDELIPAIENMAKAIDFKKHTSVYALLLLPCAYIMCLKKEKKMKIIAKIHTDFPEKFGIPRQSGLAETMGVIVFEPEYRVDEALRGIEDYSHLWLIWEFSEAKRESWSPTVRPPRLGGNKRMGVFATRSPFRPNPIGLSSVKLVSVKQTEKYGTVLEVLGADLMDNTPIYDIKPYLAFTDSHPDAISGFADEKKDENLTVEISDELLEKIPEGKKEALFSVLSQDPRPHYIDDVERVFGFPFSGFEIKFKVDGKKLTVIDIF